MIADSHAHLDLADFDDDRSQVLARARESGVNIIINAGVNLESSRQSLKLAQDYAGVFAAVGLHPNEVSEVAEGDSGLIAELAKEPKAVAIGEIGLDFYRKRAPRQRQLEVFQQQLGLAGRLRLPVIIHCRQAHDEMLKILANWVKSTGSRGELGVMHCFSGSISLARQYIEIGFLISLSGSVTYPKASNLVAVARELPLNKLMVETDSPFLAPQRYRGQRNEPAYVTLVVDRIAQIRGVPAEVIAQASLENTVRLFHIPN